jgi:mono/diheme cytochrome c family protein
MQRRTAVLRAAVGAIILSSAFLLGAAATSTRAGVYSADQAKQGESSYKKNCASCHGADLDGVGQAPPLAGEDFTSHWNGQTVDDLFEKIQSTMPADRPGALERAENADIVAYILSFNKFPAAASKLPSDADALKQIRFEAPAK